MLLLDLAIDKWQHWRTNVAKEEELHNQARHEDCQKVAYLLWLADGKPEGNCDRYYLEAQERLSGVRWQLYKLHQPFINLEKKVIEPLDSWADRANIFQFFGKISPIVEALGVLAIPFVILSFEVQQEKRQQGFEERVISAQADVRQQQAVREYLSQVTTIHLESDQGKKLREDEELQQLLAANTRALFDELSVREDARKNSNDEREFDPEAIAQARKGELVEFLSDLNWINGSQDKAPLISLSKTNLEGVDLKRANLKRANLEEANLVNADLEGADLEGADLEGVKLFQADLEGADLFQANLFQANLVDADLEGVNLFQANLVDADLEGADLVGVNLEGADLVGVNLVGANLEGADLVGVNLVGANLEGANLEGANLEGANLEGVYLANTENLTYNQIKSACNWEQAIYTDDAKWDSIGFRMTTRDTIANQQKIAQIKQDKDSDPQDPIDCD